MDPIGSNSGPTDFSTTTQQALVGHPAWPSFHKFASVECGVGKCPQWVACRQFGLKRAQGDRGSVGAPSFCSGFEGEGLKSH